MKSDHTKALLLLLSHLWYFLCILWIVPLIVPYFFDSYSILSELLAELICVGFPVAVLSVAKNKENRLFRVLNGQLSTIPRRTIMDHIIIIIAYFFLVQYIISLISLIVLLGLNAQVTLAGFEEANVVSYAVAFLTYSILPAIYEEYLYRGFYYDEYKRFSPWLTYLVSSIAFASVHANALSIANAFVLGMLLIRIYKEVKSLQLVLCMHIIYNSLSFLFSFCNLLPFSIQRLLKDRANDEQMISSILFSVGAIIALLFTIALIMRRKNKESEHEKIQTRQKMSTIQKMIVGGTFTISLFEIAYKIWCGYQ